MRRVLAVAVVFALAGGAGVQGQITYLSDQRSVTATVRLDYLPGLESYYEQYQPIAVGPLGTYSVGQFSLEEFNRAADNHDGWAEQDRQHAAASSPIFAATADAMMYRQFISGSLKRGGAGHAWQESTLAADRITATGGIFEMEAYELGAGVHSDANEGDARAASLLDVAFRLDQPATLDVAIVANLIPDPRSGCEWGMSAWCQQNQHAGDLSYIFTGPGLDYRATVRTEWYFNEMRYGGGWEVPTQSAVNETIDAAPGEYRLRLVAEGRGEPHWHTDNQSNWYHRNAAPDREWSVNVQVTPIPEPSTSIIAGVGLLLGLFLLRRHCHRG